MQDSGGGWCVAVSGVWCLVVCGWWLLVAVSRLRAVACGGRGGFLRDALEFQLLGLEGIGKSSAVAP